MLCPLAAPVSIRPPQTPHLRRFTFFTGRVRQQDGSDRLYLQMGYFETLTHAQSWLQVVRRRFPHAIATVAPAAALQPRSAAQPPQPAAPAPGTPGTQSVAPDDESLSDSQVMRILEARSAGTAHSGTDARTSARIEVARPEDTSTRRALKEAVVQGAPVYFAVQLEWSAQPIEPYRVPKLPIFKTYSLYMTASRREGRCRYFLRLGFFEDVLAAKDVAFQVHSRFASAVVVPVAEQERTGVRAAFTDEFGIAHPAQPAVDQTMDFDVRAGPAPAPKPAGGAPRRSKGRAETLEQTLERLAAKEAWTDPDSLSESGVRHLRIQVLKRKFGRPKGPR